MPVGEGGHPAASPARPPPPHGQQPTSFDAALCHMWDLHNFELNNVRRQFLERISHTNAESEALKVQLARAEDKHIQIVRDLREQLRIVQERAIHAESRAERAEKRWRKAQAEAEQLRTQLQKGLLSESATDTRASQSVLDSLNSQVAKLQRENAELRQSKAEEYARLQSMYEQQRGKNAALPRLMDEKQEKWMQFRQEYGKHQIQRAIKKRRKENDTSDLNDIFPVQTGEEGSSLAAQNKASLDQIRMVNAISHERTHEQGIDGKQDRRRKGAGDEDTSPCVPHAKRQKSLPLATVIGVNRESYINEPSTEAHVAVAPAPVPPTMLGPKENITLDSVVVLSHSQAPQTSLNSPPIDMVYQRKTKEAVVIVDETLTAEDAVMGALPSPIDIARGQGFRDPADVGPSVLMSVGEFPDEDDVDILGTEQSTPKNPTRKQNLLGASSPYSMEFSPGPLPPPLCHSSLYVHAENFAEESQNNTIAQNCHDLNVQGTIITETPDGRSVRRMRETVRSGAKEDGKSPFLVSKRKLLSPAKDSSPRVAGSEVTNARSEQSGGGYVTAKDPQANIPTVSTKRLEDSDTSTGHSDGPTSKSTTGALAKSKRIKPRSDRHRRHSSSLTIVSVTSPDKAESANPGRQPGDNEQSENIPSSRGSTSAHNKSPAGDVAHTTSKNGVPYKYHEVVRNKEQRKKMHAEDCACCTGFYKAAGPIKPLHELGAAPPSEADRLQKVSRHRHWHAPPDTPPGFWDVDFPTTQQAVAYNNEAKAARAKKQSSGH
ncbi:uncharacterized protein SPPG_01303 [Spizellomyces punctatus DAOM BR117]|uniref:DNA endonuclease activator Ctp1 C-terminal domain-containing protein n=1 Tax=Spizellomyces punctatus (strain DAOM BR117) TaxID=645134 RepID=A0A0L0HRU1_SPIPD|nr:uncharacterized protein SPPG_01303 [Spizellomyces punctatus DAOM BR117]KND03848.1 hypothetical protein SPPG_01303 [Spizellomyces punctatus DAOM BR117]|eukprot:XP_016611887.1 hypothetical protein SPPG_01303 [Spizellomyces punctatus DAOM BR117]